MVAQIVGGIAAAGVVSALFPGDLLVRTSLMDGCSITRGFFIEMFLTFELCFTIFMLAVEKHRATFMSPLGIGLALFIAELSGVHYTGGSLNPARSFGPAVVSGELIDVVFPRPSSSADDDLQATSRAITGFSGLRPLQVHCWQ